MAATAPNITIPGLFPDDPSRIYIMGFRQNWVTWFPAQGRLGHGMYGKRKEIFTTDLDQSDLLARHMATKIKLHFSSRVLGRQIPMQYELSNKIGGTHTREAKYNRGT